MSFALVQKVKELELDIAQLRAEVEALKEVKTEEKRKPGRPSKEENGQAIRP